MEEARTRSLWPKQTAAALRLQRQRWQERYTTALRPGTSQWITLTRAVEPCRTQPPACYVGAPAHLLAQDQVNWGTPREPAEICLLPHFPPEDHHSTNRWLNYLIKGCSLTVGGLWAGPTAVPTNGWAGPLTVSHWQLVSWGQGPLWHWPMAEQDH